jgi:hypothetical protein
MKRIAILAATGAAILIPATAAQAAPHKAHKPAAKTLQITTYIQTGTDMGTAPLLRLQGRRWSFWGKAH